MLIPDSLHTSLSSHRNLFMYCLVKGNKHILFERSFMSEKSTQHLIVNLFKIN